MASVSLIAWTLVLLAVVFFVVAVRSMIASDRYSTWAKVAARVVRSRVDSGDGDFVADIAYVYAVGGQEYVGGTAGSLQIVLNWRGPAERRCAEYPEGAAVEVYVDSRDPTRSMLEPPSGAMGLLLLVVGLLCGIVGLLLM
jgi:hypothetical protein